MLSSLPRSSKIKNITVNLELNNSSIHTSLNCFIAFKVTDLSYIEVQSLFLVFAISAVGMIGSPCSS